MAKPFLCLLVSSMIFSACSSSSLQAAKKPLPRGCFPMLIEEVADGDGVKGYLHTNDEEATLHTQLRMAHIDTPEKGAKARCVEEQQYAQKAKLYLERYLTEVKALSDRTRALACDYAPKKYARRRVGVLKVLSRKTWRNVGQQMVRACYAVPGYEGGAKIDWCKCLRTGECPSEFPARCAARFKAAQ